MQKMMYFIGRHLEWKPFRHKASFLKLVAFVACSVTVFLIGNHVHISTVKYTRARTCSPKTNIYFVKTHKTGGSTVQNILMRYGSSRHLDFAIPKRGNHHVYRIEAGQRKGIDQKNLPPRPLIPPGCRSKGYNISCFHGIFDKDRADKMVPAKDAVYVTILRDPVDAFESLYSFMKFESKYGMDLEEFTYTNKTLLPDQFFLQRTDNYMGVNQMLYDLGMDPYKLDDTAAVNEYVDFLEKHFHLVMIQERFDESMILLRALMCWDTDDITYLKHNVRDDQHRPRKLSSDAAARVRSMNSADQMLYEHFREVFEKAVTWYGKQQMARELQLYRSRMDDVHRECVDATVEAGSAAMLPERFRPWSDMVSGFRLRPEVEGNTTCEDLATSEHSFMDRLREMQRARFKHCNYSGV